MRYIVSAREKVEGLLTASELDRLAQKAIVAAEQSSQWHPGEEFIFEIEEDAYVFPGIERSALIVRHMGTSYEILYYDGPSSETVQ